MEKTTRKEYCPKCKNTVVGLYKNNRNLKHHPSKLWIRIAFYCDKCERVLLDDEIVYKEITYKKGAKID